VNLVGSPKGLLGESGRRAKPGSPITDTAWEPITSTGST
jgi:hypothetical protein